jgi:hypothetical protein
MKKNIYVNHTLAILIIVSIFGISEVNAQSYKWMAIGSLHNWFSEMGCEIEVGRTSGVSQQDGLQWPAILRKQDSQCAKGLWLGAKNFTDETGFPFNYKVVHVGPRVSGTGEVFPENFEMISKFEPPKVFVDGLDSYGKSVVNDDVDANIDVDRMIYNVVNTQLGITMERKILAFSHSEHDNYMIYEYTYTNTGNVDDDSEIELPNNTVEDFYAYYQYRYSPCFQSRFIIGNASGWGISTMNDARGDGTSNIATYNDPADERFRAQYSWQGYWSDRTPQHYDNIGGPIWEPNTIVLDRAYTTEDDSVGRLAAPQFIGLLTLFADDPTNIGMDDINQPSTTNWVYSNDNLTSNNSPYNQVKMQQEYEFMSQGHQTPRHAWAAEPTGNFANQQSELQSDAGYSFGNGYGPYTIGPGESIKIVMAEAVDGLGIDECIDIGRQYKKGEIDAVTKNTWVLTGKDSLFDTFRRAISNYASGYSESQAPLPPKTFDIEGGGDRIILTWEIYSSSTDIQGFRIYRNEGEFDNPFKPPVLIYEAAANERRFDDLSPIRGIGYYYYIQTVDNNGEVSNRHYTQSFDPAFLVRPAGMQMSDVRIVPNPFILSASPNRLRFGSSEPDKLAFFNIPGQCTIQIFTETGELVYTIEHTNGSGDEYWKGVNYSNQLVVSGIYIAVIKDNVTGEQGIVKFVVIR